MATRAFFAASNAAAGNVSGTISSSVGSSSSIPALLSELVPPPVKAGHYVVQASQERPVSGAPAVPPMPSTSGARVKAAPPPAEPRSSERRSDAATGNFDFRPGESSRQRQWRLYGVWRCRGGRRQAEFRPWWKRKRENGYSFGAWFDKVSFCQRCGRFFTEIVTFRFGYVNK